MHSVKDFAMAIILALSATIVAAQATDATAAAVRDGTALEQLRAARPTTPLHFGSEAEPPRRLTSTAPFGDRMWARVVHLGNLAATGTIGLALDPADRSAAGQFLGATGVDLFKPGDTLPAAGLLAIAATGSLATGRRRKGQRGAGNRPL